MKKSLVTLLLVFATAAAAQQAPPAAAQAPAGQQPPAAGQAAPAPGQAPAAAPQKKEIKDPAEYNAYVAAVQTADPNAKATALESFLQTYPNSVMKEDATELLMKTYQQTGNVQKIMETGQRLLQINPNNLTALALLSYLNRMQAQQGGPQAQQLLQQAGEYANRGMQQLQSAPKPEGYQDADWAKMKESFRTIFAGSAGNAALARQDYPTAQQELKASVAANPNNFLDVYQLALAYLEPKPPVVDGLFWIARARALAQQQAPQAVPNIERYARSKYIRYHGSEQGFPELLQAATSSPTIPAGFTVAPAPSPAEQADMMMKEKPVTKMGFGEWEFILTSGNQAASEQVWTAIKGKPLQMLGNVIQATATKLSIAATEDAIQANKPEIELTMAGPIPAKLLPKPGSQITFEGTPVAYTPEPFLVQMNDGALLSKGGAATTAKPSAGKAGATKAPARKKK